MNTDPIDYRPTSDEVEAAAGAVWARQVRVPFSFAQPDQQEFFLELAELALIAAHLVREASA